MAEAIRHGNRFFSRLRELVIDVFQGKADGIIDSFPVRPPECVAVQPVVGHAAAHREGDLQLRKILTAFRQLRAKDAGIVRIHIEDTVIVIGIGMGESRILSVYKDMIRNKESIGRKTDTSILFQLLQNLLPVFLPQSNITVPVLRRNPISILQFCNPWLISIHTDGYRPLRCIKSACHGEGFTVVAVFQQCNAGVVKFLRILFLV